MSRRQGVVAALAALALLLLAGRAVSATWADQQWFAALGAADVWRRQWFDTLLARGVAFAFGTAFAAANLAGVRQSILLLVLPRRLGNLEIGEQVSPRALNVAVALVAVALGGALAWFAPGGMLVPYGRGGIAFGETDPYFDRDLGFFVYRLPFEAAWYEWAVMVAAGVGVAVIVLYALTPALRWRAGQLRMSGWVRRHLTVLGAVVLALLAWGLRLDTYALPVEGSGIDGMFTALDHRVLVRANIVLSVVTFAVSLVVLWAGWSGQVRLAFAGVTVVLAGALLVRGVLPVAGERLLGPDGSSPRDAPYAATRLSYTRRAFAVEAVRGGSDAFGPDAPAAALGGVPLWDPAALRTLVERSRSGQRVVGDLGWRHAGAYAAVLAVAPPAPEAVAPWSVLVADPRRDAEGTGLPRFTEQPVAPVLVHPGARAPLVTGDPDGQVAAPPFRGMLSRLLHAWALQRPQLLATPEAADGDDPVLVTGRDVRERLERLAPHFLQGSTVTPIVAADTLWWSLELYSASASYPLSRRLAVPGGDVHYYRHAGSALVNATTGRVQVALRNDLDPLARTWAARLGRLAVRRDQLPAMLAAALGPPVDGARAQAMALALAGTRDAPAALARRVPSADGADTLLAAGGATLWRLPSGDAAWSTPMVNGADSVVGLVVATGGASPTTRFVPTPGAPGWGEGLERLATAGDGLRGDVRRVAGRARAVPYAGGGVVLVQPRFSWPVAGPPSLDGLAAVVGGEVKVGRTLGAVGGPPDAGDEERPLDAATRQRLGPLYDRLRASLARGDFAEFGRLLDRLGRALGRVPEPGREP
ncbi:MAG: UPF0182 family protein [Gemmatimonadaceae bacterium]|nr:UPF0182 family protein [Gemmatimonadaceae bacterium]